MSELPEDHSYAAGILVWFIDIRFCMGFVPVLQLHALWHVLVSVGFYALLLVIAARPSVLTESSR